MTAWSCRRRPRGFSLLELILAIAMAAMLALSLYTAMNVALRARATAQRAVEPTRTVMIAMDILQQDFASVPPPTGTLGGPFYGTHAPGGAGGDSDSVEFCSFGADPVEGDPAAASPLSEGIRRIELYVGGDASTPVLMRRVTRNLLPSSEASAEEEVVCRNVRSFALRYFDGVAWMEDWDSTIVEDTLPLAVAITLDLGDARDPQTPGKRMTRVIPLPCAKPAGDGAMTMIGGAP
jgi:type II secretion system protein J